MLLTAEQLPHASPPNMRTELVRGVMMVRELAGYRHGAVASRVHTAISVHVHAHELGAVIAAETGFKLFSNPDTVRAPDVAFIRRDRMPDPATAGYASIVPDLVVEVLSPGDRPGEVDEKIDDWLTAGVRLVWIIDPVRRTGRVHRADGSAGDIPADGAFDGEDVLPEFRMSIAAAT